MKKKKKNKKINEILESMSNVAKEIDKEINKLVEDVKNTEPYFHVDWILKSMMNLTDEEIKKTKHEVCYLDKSWEDKRKILRQFMMKSKEANTAVMTMIERMKIWCVGIKQMYSDAIITESLFVDGYVALEVIYSKDCKTILSLEPLDPATLMCTKDPSTGDNVWIQFNDNPALKRVLLKDQIIYVTGNPTTGVTSVAEGIYLNILDMENPYVIDNVCKRISNNIIDAIKDK